MLCILYRLDIYHCDVSMRDIGFPNTEAEPAVDQVQFLMVVDKEWTSHCRQMVCYGMFACSNISEGTLFLSSITESFCLQIMIRSIFLDLPGSDICCPQHLTTLHMVSYFFNYWYATSVLL